MTSDPRATFERVADELRERIRTGDLQPGSRLPSGRELATQHGIALATAQSALRSLRDEGVAESSPRGYFVSKAPGGSVQELRRDLDETRAEVRALAARVAALEDPAPDGDISPR